MNRELAEKVADAVLYEGYMLYPYRPSAMKNRQRWTFGTIYPPSYGEVGRGTEPAAMHVECLFSTSTPEQVSFGITLRFLHLLTRKFWDKESGEVASLKVDDQVLESWDEPTPRSVEFRADGLPNRVQHQFHFPGHHEAEPVRDACSHILGSMSRTQYEISGLLSLFIQELGDGLFKLNIDLSNETSQGDDTEDRTQSLLRSMLSAHLILAAEGGEFVSLLDPPTEFLAAAESCKNVGNFPVLVGDSSERDMLLCSPILLYDYPQIAPESAGDFYDATEIDEMLTLRVMTLTDEEKQEMRLADDRVRSLLERTEATAREQLIKTHGTFRNLRRVSGQ